MGDAHPNWLSWLIIRLLIQTIRQNRSGSIWTDDPSDVSRPDRSGSDQIEVEHQATELVLAAIGRPRGQGQAQLKASTSSTRRIGELQLTAVRDGQPLGDVEPKPTAVAGGPRVQAHMTLEDPVAVGQRDPGPLILDGQ